MHTAHVDMEGRYFSLGYLGLEARRSSLSNAHNNDERESCTSQHFQYQNLRIHGSLSLSEVDGIDYHSTRGKPDWEFPLHRAIY